MTNPAGCEWQIVFIWTAKDSQELFGGKHGPRVTICSANKCKSTIGRPSRLPSNAILHCPGMQVCYDYNSVLLRESNILCH